MQKNDIFITFCHLFNDPITHTKHFGKTKFGSFLGQFFHILGSGHFGPKSTHIAPKNDKKCRKMTFFALFLYLINNPITPTKHLGKKKNGPFLGNFFIFFWSFWGSTLDVTLTSDLRKYGISI